MEEYLTETLGLDNSDPRVKQFFRELQPRWHHARANQEENIQVYRKGDDEDLVYRLSKENVNPIKEEKVGIKMVTISRHEYMALKKPTI